MAYPGYGAPQGGQYGVPQQQGYGAPGVAPGGYGAPGVAPGGYGAPGGYPPQQPGYGQPGYGQQPPQQGWAPPGIDPQVYQWFQAVDSDRSGRISVTELQQALTNANWSHFNAETCRLMIGMFDRDQSGQIDLNEFQSLWKYIHEWKGVFDSYDRDRSGAIEQQELHNALNQMGYRLSPQFVQMIIFKYDIHARRCLTLDNFIQACVLLRSLTDSFRHKDTNMSGTIQISYDDFMCMTLLNK